jgi:hypothetical protein
MRAGAMQSSPTTAIAVHAVTARCNLLEER